MTFGFFGNCLLQWFIIKIVTAQMPATKYIQMGNMSPVRPSVPGMPNVPMPYPTSPTFPSLLHTYLPNYPNLPSLPNLSLPLPSVPNVPPVALPPGPPPLHPLAFPIPTSNMKVPMPPRTYFDPTVINNLAIALHLLILTNLLHPSEPEASKPNFPAEAAEPPQTAVTYQTPQSPPNQPYPQPPPNLVQGYYASEPQEPPPPSFTPPNPQPSYSPPNSQFLSSSGFVEPMPPSMMGVPMPGYGSNSNPRNSYSLMSPYEALGPGPQGKDVFAQYGPQNLKADFQSPYNSIMAHENASKDLFNMF